MVGSAQSPLISRLLHHRADGLQRIPLQPVVDVNQRLALRVLDTVERRAVTTGEGPACQAWRRQLNELDTAALGILVYNALTPFPPTRETGSVPVFA